VTFNWDVKIIPSNRLRDKKLSDYSQVNDVIKKKCLK